MQPNIGNRSLVANLAIVAKLVANLLYVANLVASLAIVAKLEVNLAIVASLWEKTSRLIKGRRVVETTF